VRALAILCVLAATARAQPDLEAAKGHYKQGKAYQEAGAFMRAVDEFKAAYAIDPRPEMLFNIAQVYRLAGDKPHALDYFKQYLAAQPEGKASDEARVLVAELQRQIDEDNAHTAPPPPPPRELPPPQQSTIEVRASPTLRVAGLVTAGTGALALALGVKFALDAQSDNDYITHFVGTWGPTEEQRFADGQAANRDMKIAYVAGGVLAATGAVLFVLGSRMRAEPVISSQHVGVSLVESF
jgi:tetratricopeptide (TPR) repeat protein